LENKNIEKVDLSCKLIKNKKGNKINTKGLSILKDSLSKNQFLKEINFAGK
jgi:hypothetical protein